MSDILYVFEGKVYVNLTNQCPCCCTFCIRKNGKSVGDATNLWHTTDPTIEEDIEALKAFDFTGFKDVVFCGYGEPTMALDALFACAKYLKENHPSLRLRLNTNGLSKLIHNRSIVKDLFTCIDSVSVSMNAPNAKRYCEVTKPIYGLKAFRTMLDFAKECKRTGIDTRFTVVDVISPEEIKLCQEMADKLRIPLVVRHYIAKEE